ncbi:hypothetical protein ZWY2020_046554 [Hordeum vulgare]|nr:hypothetical protein ZWY2020_046554 [Hordeum vulgare]
MGDDAPALVTPLKRLQKGPRQAPPMMQSIPQNEVPVTPSASVDEVLTLEGIPHHQPEVDVNAGEDIDGDDDVAPDEPLVPATPSTDDNAENIVMAHKRDGEMVPTRRPRFDAAARMVPQYELNIFRRPGVMKPMPSLPSICHQGQGYPIIFSVQHCRLIDTFCDPDINPYTKTKIQSDSFGSMPECDYYSAVLYG